MKRLLLVAAVAAGVAAAAPYAAAQPVPPVVEVDADASDGSVGASSHVGRQPIAGVTVADDGEACVSISYRVPECAP